MNNINLNIFLKYLEKQNIDMKMVNSFLSSLNNDKITSIYDSIKEIIYKSTLKSVNYKYYLLLDDISYDFLFKFDKEIEQEFIITFVSNDVITNFLEMNEFENRFKYLPFIINEIRKNKLIITKEGTKNEYMLNNIYLIRENDILHRNITISELLTYNNSMQKENLDKQSIKEKILKTFNFYRNENNSIYNLSNNNNDITELKKLLYDDIIRFTTNNSLMINDNRKISTDDGNYFRKVINNLKYITDNLIENIFLIVEKDNSGYYKIMDILEYDIFVKKYLLYYPETLKFILTNKKYKLTSPYIDDSTNIVFNKILVIDLLKIKINIIDTNNILNKIIQILENL